MRALASQRGFTLAELLVVVAVLGLMMGALFTLQQQGQQAYLVGAARVEVQQNARIALEMMTTEIRSALAVTNVGAGCDTGPVPTGGGATTISITDQNGNAVQYQLAGTNLQRNGVVVIGGVETLRIWCFSGTDALVAVAASVRSVRIRIATQTERGVAANNPANQHALVDTRVRLRNVL